MIRLVAGQNLPWSELRVTAYLDDPAVSVCALLLGDGYRVRSAEDLVDDQRRHRSGVEWLAGPPAGITIDLTAVDADVERILFVAGAATHRPVTVRLLAASGDVLADFEPVIPAGSVVVLTEVYRRDGGWKVRAVGQAYAGGLTQALAAHGVVAPRPTVQPPSVQAPMGQPSAAAAERTYEDLLRQNRMILEDASRTTASLEATRDFARRRWEADLERVVGDPSLRVGERGDRARHEAQQRHQQMLREAEDRHRADLEHLQRELSVFESDLPAPLARWAQPVWAGWRPSDRLHQGFRVGELALPDAPMFAMPFLLALPMGRPLWIEIDNSDEVATLVLRTAAARVLVATAAALTRVSVIDIGGRRGALGIPDELLHGPPAVDAAGAQAVLAELVDHLELLGTALASGSVDVLDPRHQADRLVLVTDLPTGLDEVTLRHLITVIEHGPRLGVHLMVTGTHAESLNLPLLEWLRTFFLRVTSVPGGDLVDGFGGVEWTFLPDAGPSDPRVLDEVLGRLAASRTDPQSLRRRT
ncbi:putative Stress protein [metagenome]|uniref:Putative Stress protein n=1 Tax=metagenome TaxID=256318 RepID=A0A2P2CBL9_9ZZZZ